MRNSRPILLVEDGRVDVMMIKRALCDLKVANSIVHSVNGIEALRYLRNDDNDKPCVVLLDLNMPRMNGIEFMRKAKADEQMRKIPIVVLTTSTEEQDIVDSFDLSAAGYIVKPLDYRKFVEAIRTVNLYWTVSKLPCGK